MNISLMDYVCEASIRLYYGHWCMKLIFGVELLLGIVAMLGAILLTLSIFFNETLHFNVRILLISFCTALLVANIGIVLSSMYYLLAIFYRSPGERCQWLTFTKPDCSALKNVYNLGTTVVVVSTLFISVERIIATLLYRTYEQEQRRWIGVLLTIVQWTVALPTVLCQKRDNGLILPYCALELYNPTLSKGIDYALIVIQSCAMLIFMVLCSHNHKKSTKERPHENALSVRYQLRENISTTKLMVPIVLLNGFFMCALAILYGIFLPIYDINSNVDSFFRDVSRYGIYAEIQCSMLPLMTIVLVYFMSRSNAPIRQSLGHFVGLKGCISKNTNVVDVTPEEHVRQLYFDQLQQQWNHRNGEHCDQSHAIKRTERAVIYAT